MKTNIALFFGVISLFVSLCANSALVSRLGGLAVYDTDLDVTWLADANLAASNTFGVAGINSDGTMSWYTAMAWIDAMNAAGGTGYLGVSDWRLPITVQPDPGCEYQYDPGGGYPVQGYGWGCTASEMAHLELVEDIYAGDTRPTNPFINITFAEYWSGTEYAPDNSYAWRDGFDLSVQDINLKTYEANAWAVRSGDIGAIPLPASVWLFGSGLLALAGCTRRCAQPRFSD